MNKIKDSFIAGAVGAFGLIVILTLINFANIGFVSPQVANYKELTGDDIFLDFIIGTFLFTLAGGIWGIVYSKVIKHPTTFNGIIFASIPPLILLIAATPFMNGWFLKGFPINVLFPLILFSVVVWGGFVGRYLFKKQKQK